MSCHCSLSHQRDSCLFLALSPCNLPARFSDLSNHCHLSSACRWWLIYLNVAAKPIFIQLELATCHVWKHHSPQMKLWMLPGIRGHISTFAQDNFWIYVKLPAFTKVQCASRGKWFISLRCLLFSSFWFRGLQEGDIFALNGFPVRKCPWFVSLLQQGITFARWMVCPLSGLCITWITNNVIVCPVHVSIWRQISSMF